MKRYSKGLVTACWVLSRFSCVRLFLTPWTIAHQSLLSMGFSRQEYWSGLPCPSPDNRPDPGREHTTLASPALQAVSLPTWEALGNANQNHGEIPYHNHIWFDDNKWCGEWGAIRTLIHYCGWDCKMLQQLWKPARQFLKLLNIDLPLRGTHPK